MADYFGFDETAVSTPEGKAKEAIVVDLWKEVLASVLDVLKAHSGLGFDEFHQKTDPTIVEMELNLTVAQGALRSLSDWHDLTFEASQRLANCIQSTHLMLRVFVAIRQQNREEYDDCIRKLQTQRQH